MVRESIIHKMMKCQLSGPQYGARSVSVFGASLWKPSLPISRLANHGWKWLLTFVHLQIACLNRIVLPDPGEEHDDGEDEDGEDGEAEDEQDGESGTEASDA
jgi:hypothetical protein